MALALNAPEKVTGKIWKQVTCHIERNLNANTTERQKVKEGKLIIFYQGYSICFHFALVLFVIDMPIVWLIIFC